MDDMPPFPGPMRLPTPGRPLLGLTVLLVEDSRYACEAMRLLCLRSGARLRRADTLLAAHRHLKTYRPSAIIVDLGLPDGSGLDLIADLNRANPRVPVLLGISGNDDVEDDVVAAGADGFLAKPVTSLAVFQAAILSRLPAEMQPRGPRPVNEEVIEPDPLAYHDDIALAAETLSGDGDEARLDYVAQFLGGVARAARDRPLADAAAALARTRAAGGPVTGDTARIAGLIHDRLHGARAF
jgi:CheY-like chemotaxis protein